MNNNRLRPLPFDLQILAESICKTAIARKMHGQATPMWGQYSDLPCMLGTACSPAGSIMDAAVIYATPNKHKA